MSTSESRQALHSFLLCVLVIEVAVIVAIMVFAQ